MRKLIVCAEVWGGARLENRCSEVK